LALSAKWAFSGDEPFAEITVQGVSYLRWRVHRNGLAGCDGVEGADCS